MHDGAAASSNPGVVAGRVLRTGLVSVQFAGLLALNAVDLGLLEGELLGLIGPNGAGKTTLLNTLTGFQAPSSGRVFLDSEDITRLSVAARARRGIARTFQMTHSFVEMTALENIEVA